MASWSSEPTSPRRCRPPVTTTAPSTTTVWMSDADADGWTRTTVPIESVRHGHHALLQLGEHVEVLEPPELRELVAASARTLAARYSAGGVSAG